MKKLLVMTQLEIAVAPEGDGCLSILIDSEPGEPVQAFGAVPPALIGAKWGAVHTWFVFYWHAGSAWCSMLKSDCGYRPPELWAVENNFTAYPERWRPLTVKPKAKSPGGTS